ncbi:MAG: hypothetical protein NZ922_04165 [Candidatus Methanomethyliaceae archaeon]|nr:hypothetical protein [Candidatus Methanomethyliaceae archaeon]
MYYEVQAVEDEDWDYARNKQIVLKSALGEWSSSVFSSEVFVNGERFIGPNRDYPFQGLITFYDGKILKLIDGIFFSLDRGLGEKVLVGSYDVRYIYPNLEVTFGFNEECFRISFNKENCRILLLFEDYMRYNIMNDWIVVNLNNLNFNFGPFDHIEKVNYHTEWIYKLGCGFRYRDCDGSIRFIRERRNLFAPFICTLRGNLLKIYINNLRDPWNIRESNWINKLIFFNEVVGELIKYRLSTLRCFGLNIDGIWFPEAGCWWFRSPWIRDALEGILSNFQIYTRIFGWEDKVRRLTIFLLELLKRNKGLPNFLGGIEESADSPPLLLYLSSKLGINADKLALEILKEMEKREISENGKPILKDGLIACIPYQSWTDSRIDGRAYRIPEGWKDWNLPKYLLPEVNGYWIMALRTLYKATGNKNIKEILEEMELEFRRKFWNGDFISDIIDMENNLKSNEITSMGLVGLSSTIHLFNEEELILAFKNLKPLMVYRTMKILGNQTLPFGIAITQKISPYFGDEEYHKSTIWPRDIPYLIKFLEIINREEDINGILLNSLDHMVSEGALFYINEIFGHAVGKNPSPKGINMNPIPLKNPAQYWSHWCDPYLGRFMRER